MRKAMICVGLLALAISLAAISAAKTGGKTDKDSAATIPATAANHAPLDDPMRLEGEKRFHANCGR